ncbi:hypothetical protein K503DRAFT_390113 [Rhizopogon vinicolor AM-OR11-026]|uniref:Uncharacterized protein n=1 Tax=Rhizopogon vinicolor AM-OR11-026 TaxID=1314800 RepID=A0A1B7MRJ7_9AGAM|nr:hypothetical protein K503DRAFT_390113 [Rhizopogon vinicolor AM-OR11-026]
MISAPLPDLVLPIATRRQLLRRRETAWQKTEYSKRHHIHFPGPDMHFQYRSRGIIQVSTRERVKFMQSPSLSASGCDHSDTTNGAVKSTVLVYRAVAVFRPCRIFWFSLLECPRNHELEVASKPLSEDKVHPDAASAVVVPEPIGIPSFCKQ